MARALARLHAAPGAAITLARLARACGTSRATLTRRFRDAVGEPPLAYLARVRMERAALALRDRPDQSVDAIAEAHGYASPAAFSRAFKRWMGVGPGALRKGAAGPPGPGEGGPPPGGRPALAPVGASVDD